MSKARKDWHVNHCGDLELELRVEVNGRFLASRMTVADYARYGINPPFRHIEQQLRRQLMAVIEEELLGPRL